MRSADTEWRIAPDFPFSYSTFHPVFPEGHQDIVRWVICLHQAAACIAKTCRLKPPCPVLHRAEVPRFLPIHLPGKSETGVEYGMRQRNEGVHLRCLDVMVAHDEQPVRPKYSPDGSQKRIETFRVHMVQSHVTSHQVNAAIRNARLADGRVIVEWDPCAELSQPSTLDEIDWRVCRRDVVYQYYRAAKTEGFAQMAHIPASRANLDVALDLPPLA